MMEHFCRRSRGRPGKSVLLKKHKHDGKQAEDKEASGGSGRAAMRPKKTTSSVRVVDSSSSDSEINPHPSGALAHPNYDSKTLAKIQQIDEYEFLLSAFAPSACICRATHFFREQACPYSNVQAAQMLRWWQGRSCCEGSTGPMQGSCVGRRRRHICSRRDHARRARKVRHARSYISVGDGGTCRCTAVVIALEPRRLDAQGLTYGFPVRRGRQQRAEGRRRWQPRLY